MNKQSHLMNWDTLRMRHGILLRLLDQIPAEQLTRHPIAGMRTPVEIVVHIYASAEKIAASVLTGTLGPVDEASIAKNIRTPEQLRAFVDAAWKNADRDAQAVTDAQLQSPVHTPWGKDFPGFVMLSFVGDELQHHRGQLYAYVRTYGIEPVFVWDFDHNAPEFAPRQHAQK